MLFAIAAAALALVGADAAGAQTPTDDAGSGASGLLWWMLFAIWTATAAFLTVFGVRALRRRRRRGPQLAVAPPAPTSARSGQTSQPATGGRPRAAERPKERNVSQPAPQASDPGRQGSFDEIGTSVAGILQAAEAAADQIRAEAVKAATGIREAADDEAKARVARAENEVTKLRREAQVKAKEAQSAAEAELESQRKEAEAQVRSILAAAKTQARAVHDAAEEEARAIEVAAREREAALRAQVQPLEENVQRLLETVRFIGGQLEEAVADIPGRAGVSLVADLTESAKAAEARVERAANR